MKTKKHPNFLKHLLQWGVLAAIVGTILHARWTEQPVDVEAYCPFGGLEALSTYLQRHSLACSMSMLQIMMGIVLGVGVILFSRTAADGLESTGVGNRRLASPLRPYRRAIHGLPG